MNFSDRATTSKRLWKPAFNSKRRVGNDMVVISLLPAGRFSPNSQRFDRLLGLVDLQSFKELHPRTVEKLPCEVFRPSHYCEAPVETRALQRETGRKGDGGDIFASSQPIYTKLAAIRDIARLSRSSKFKKISSIHFRETTV